MIYNEIYSRREKTGYDTAQICMNGHVITRSFHDWPDHRQNYCDKCGEKTITACPQCNAEIRGHLRGSMPSLTEPPPPRFCVECGKAYPWTEMRLEVLKDYANELEELTSNEKQELQEAVTDLARSTPKAPVAQKKFKRIMAKLGRDTYEGVKGIVTDIVSETVKKTLFG